MTETAPDPSPPTTPHTTAPADAPRTPPPRTEPATPPTPAPIAVSLSYLPKCAFASFMQLFFASLEKHRTFLRHSVIGIALVRRRVIARPGASRLRLCLT